MKLQQCLSGMLPLPLSIIYIILYTVGDKLYIILAEINPTRSEMLVVWSTNDSDYVNIASISALNNEINFEKTVIVERDIREVSFFVNPTIAYNVTVVIYDKCQGIHKSERSSVYVKDFTQSSVLQYNTLVSQSTVLQPRSPTIGMHR